MSGPHASTEVRTDLLEGVEKVDLSPWFNPFLRSFAQETVRCGGEVRTVRDDRGVVEGLSVWDPIERVATVFTRSRAIAERVVRERGSYGVFCDFSFEDVAEPYDIFSIHLGHEELVHRFRHSIRSYGPTDRADVVGLMREVYGLVNERWFDGLPSRNEVGFVAEINGRVIGVAWVARAGDAARLHSLTVRPPCRRMGIGSDLLAARLLWSRRVGARTVVSEIARLNVPSRTLAERSGMQRDGEIFFHRPR